MSAHLADGVVMGERLQWYDERADNAPRTDAFARKLAATRRSINTAQSDAAKKQAL
jgi:hypothetical protein